MEVVKDFFNILFFIIMGVIAILSYLQARKTLFSPIRTEVFKIQIEELKNVLKFFNKQSSANFDSDFDMRQIVELNARKMHIAYVNTFFSDRLKPDEEVEEHFKKITCGAIMPAKYLKVVTAGSELKDKRKEEAKELTPALQLAKWKEFEVPGVSFTHKYNEKLEELLSLAASPLLPKELTDLIYDFYKVVTANLVAVGDAVNKCAQELPTKYPTAEDNVKFRPNWIWNEYVGKRQSMDDVSEKILRFINSHLKINDIMS